ncbi:MAG: hypothetical protein ABI775_07590 [Pseudonocardiales bacterium]
MRAALGAAATLAAGAGIALASVPAAQPDNGSVARGPVSATNSAARGELARLQAELAGSAHDTALLRALVSSLQREVRAAQARLDQVPPAGHRAATVPGAVPTVSDPAPTMSSRHPSTVAPMRTNHPTSPPRPSPTDDRGSDDD